MVWDGVQGREWNIMSISRSKGSMDASTEKGKGWDDMGWGGEVRVECYEH